MASTPGYRLSSKNLNSPDQVRSLGHGSGGYVEVAGLAIGRATLEPGRRWSLDVKPLVGTTSCLIHHFQLLLVDDAHDGHRRLYEDGS